MGRKSKIDKQTLEVARKYCRNAKTVEEVRMALAVIIPEHFRISLAETAKIIGVSEPTVSRLRKRMESIRKTGSAPRGNWGGRRKSNLTKAEESGFLQKWAREAKVKPMHSLTPVHKEYVALLGMPVPKSTVYRLLKRNGWKKGIWHDKSKAWFSENLE